MILIPHFADEKVALGKRSAVAGELLEAPSCVPCPADPHIQGWPRAGHGHPHGSRSIPEPADVPNAGTSEFSRGKEASGSTWSKQLGGLPAHDLWNRPDWKFSLLVKAKLFLAAAWGFLSLRVDTLVCLSSLWLWGQQVSDGQESLLWSESQDLESSQLREHRQDDVEAFLSPQGRL